MDTIELHHFWSGTHLQGRIVGGSFSLATFCGCIQRGFNFPLLGFLAGIFVIQGGFTIPSPQHDWQSHSVYVTMLASTISVSLRIMVLYFESSGMAVPGNLRNYKEGVNSKLTHVVTALWLYVSWFNRDTGRLKVLISVSFPVCGRTQQCQNWMIHSLNQPSFLGWYLECCSRFLHTKGYEYEEDFAFTVSPLVRLQFSWRAHEGKCNIFQGLCYPVNLLICKDMCKWLFGGAILEHKPTLISSAWSRHLENVYCHQFPWSSGHHWLQRGRPTGRRPHDLAFQQIQQCCTVSRFIPTE